MARDMKYGQRLLPTLIDSFAKETPEKVWLSIPKSTEIEDGFVDLTFSRCASVINWIAGHLIESLGKGDHSRILTYWGLSDVRFYFVAVATAKAGYTALFCSPRNNMEGTLNMIDKTDCKILVRGCSSSAADLLKEREMETVDLPSLDDLLAKKDVPQVPFEETWESAADKTFIILHTSGSTGLPKPVDITHRLVTTVDAFHYLEPVNGQELMLSHYAESRMYCSLPPFHSAGINFALCFAVFFDTVMICGPSDRLPSADLALEIAKYEKIDGAIMAPTILEELTHDAQGLDFLASLKYVTFGGGPLSQEAGNKIAEITTLLNTLGSTETFVLPELVRKDKKAWSYHQYHPDLGFEMRPVDEGLFELVFVRREREQERRVQGAFHTFQDLSEYSMKDLYAPHPTIPDCWLYSGRLDDIVVLSTGEKLNPSAMEKKLASNPDVKDAIIAGDGEFHPVALIELKDSSELLKLSREDRREKLWETVKDANESAPGHGKLGRDSMAFVPDDAEFPRSSKGSVQRAAAKKMYADQISALFVEDQDSSTSAKASLDATDIDTLMNSLSKYFQTVVDADNIQLDDSFFDIGMDSLQLLKLGKALRSTFKDRPESSRITNRNIYSNATIRKLSNLIMNGDTSNESLQEEMQRSLEALSQKLPVAALSTSNQSRSTISVAVTGTTGSLGPYLLDALVKDPYIEKIFCLNRSHDAQDRQASASKTLNLQDGITEGKSTFLTVDTREQYLGLERDVFFSVQNSVQSLIHNAWLVDFNLPFSSFSSHLQGVRELIEFCATANEPVHFTFLSSVGAANNWPLAHKGAVPEKIILDYDTTEPSGYAQSKLVAEQLLERAGDANLKSTICRVAQIGGPVGEVKGMWKKAEWFPRLLQTSKSLGILPRNIGRMNFLDWVPVNKLAEGVVEILHRSDNDSIAGNVEVLHAVNPKRVAWDEIAGVAAESLFGEGTEDRVVEWSEWLAKLEEVEAKIDDDEEKYPALKLLDWFRGLGSGEEQALYETELMGARSETFKEMDAVNSIWLKQWLEQWNF